MKFSLYSAPDMVLTFDPTSCLLTRVSVAKWQKSVAANDRQRRECGGINRFGLLGDGKSDWYFTFNGTNLLKWQFSTGASIWASSEAFTPEPSSFLWRSAYLLPDVVVFVLAGPPTIVSIWIDDGFVAQSTFADDEKITKAWGGGSIHYNPQTGMLVLDGTESGPVAVGFVRTSTRQFLKAWGSAQRDLPRIATANYFDSFVRQINREVIVYSSTTAKERCKFLLPWDPNPLQLIPYHHVGTNEDVILLSGNTVILIGAQDCQAKWTQSISVGRWESASFTDYGNVALSTPAYILDAVTGSILLDASHMQDLKPVSLMPGTQPKPIPPAFISGGNAYLVNADATLTPMGGVNALQENGALRYAVLDNTPQFVVTSRHGIAAAVISDLHPTVDLTTNEAVKTIGYLPFAPGLGADLNFTLVCLESTISIFNFAVQPQSSPIPPPSVFFRFSPTVSVYGYSIVGSFLLLFASENDKLHPYDPLSLVDHIFVIYNSQIAQIIDFAETCVDPDEDPYVEPSLDGFEVAGQNLFFVAGTRCLYKLACKPEDGLCSATTLKLDNYGLQVPLVVGSTAITVDQYGYAYAVNTDSMRLQWKSNVGYFPRYGSPSDPITLCDASETPNEFVVVTGPVAVAVRIADGNVTWVCPLDVNLPDDIDVKKLILGHDPDSDLMIASINGGTAISAFTANMNGTLVWQFLAPQSEPATLVVRTELNEVARNGVVVVALKSRLLGLNARTGVVVWSLPLSFQSSAEIAAQVQKDVLFITEDYATYVINITSGAVIASHWGASNALYSAIAVSSDGSVIAYGRVKRYAWSPPETHIVVLEGMKLPPPTPPPTATTTTAHVTTTMAPTSSSAPTTQLPTATPTTPTTTSQTSKPPATSTVPPSSGATTALTTTPPPSSTQSPRTSGAPAAPDTGVSGGTVAAISVGGVAFLCVGGLLVWLFVLRKGPSTKLADTESNPGESMSERVALTNAGDTFGSVNAAS